MFYFGFFVMLLAGISGLYLGVTGFRRYRSIMRTTDKISVLQIIKIAVILGISTSLIFFAIMSFGALIGNEYVWTLQKLGGSILVAVIPGIVVTLGSAYQIYTTLVFRDMLIRKFQGNDKSEHNNK